MQCVQVLSIEVAIEQCEACYIPPPVGENLEGGKEFITQKDVRSKTPNYILFSDTFAIICYDLLQHVMAALQYILNKNRPCFGVKNISMIF